MRAAGRSLGTIQGVRSGFCRGNALFVVRSQTNVDRHCRNLSGSLHSCILVSTVDFGARQSSQYKKVRFG